MIRAAVHAEWIKLRTVRSTYLALGIGALLGLGVGAVTMIGTVRGWPTMDAAQRAAIDPVSDSFDGFQLAQLAFGALGVWVATSEHGGGIATSTLLALPRRGLAYTAKVAVLAGVALVVCEVCALAAYLVGQVVLSRRHLAVTLASPHALRAVVMAGSYLAAVTVIGLALGTLLRHTGAATAVLVGVVFLSWPAARALESFSYLPDHLALANISDALVATRPVTGPHAQRTPSFGVACWTLAANLLVFLGLGAWRARRDLQ